MKLNTMKSQVHTHEGAVAKQISPLLQLKRSTMSCMLWEKEFYEEGKSIAERIASLIPLVKAEDVVTVASDCRNKMHLRHVPLLIASVCAGLASHKSIVSTLLFDIIKRPDELAEFLSIYWKDEKKPLSAQIKKGLAKAFTKFNEYSLAKYNQNRTIKLRDVLFLCHAKPKDEEQASLWKRLANNELSTPDTWEVVISATEDKKAEWERLLKEKKLGGLALLRNLRNMIEAKVESALITSSIESMHTDRILPFRFIAAARYAPQFEPFLEKAMWRGLEDVKRLSGKTVLLIDVSGSMNSSVSEKSELTRMDAACGLAMLLREIGEDVRVITFSDMVKEVAPRRGFALRDAIISSQPHSGTKLGFALDLINLKKDFFDRMICITDEQATAEKIPESKLKKAYMVNVASYQHGVGYGSYTHIDGFSESIVDFIQTYEEENCEGRD